MRSRLALFLIVLTSAFACLGWPAPAAAQPTAQLQEELKGIEVVERRGAEVPPDLAFTDHEGRRVTFGELRGHPFLLTFNYSTCPKLCSLQLAGLAKALASAGRLPEGTRIVRVGISPKETQEQAQKGQIGSVRTAGGTPEMAEAWRFWRGDERDIRAAADAVGFRFRFRPETGDYVHPAALFVVSADGRVSRVFGGIDYDPAVLRIALERAAVNDLRADADFMTGVVFSCLDFDARGSAPTALVVMRVSGLVLIGLLALFFAVLAYRKHGKRRLADVGAR